MNEQRRLERFSQSYFIVLNEKESDYTYLKTEGFDLSALRMVECSVQWATIPVSIYIYIYI